MPKSSQCELSRSSQNRHQAPAALVLNSGSESWKQKSYPVSLYLHHNNWCKGCNVHVHMHIYQSLSLSFDNFDLARDNRKLHCSLHKQKITIPASQVGGKQHPYNQEQEILRYNPISYSSSAYTVWVQHALNTIYTTVFGCYSCMNTTIMMIEDICQQTAYILKC